jgi:hypothetical protein
MVSVKSASSFRNFVDAFVQLQMMAGSIRGLRTAFGSYRSFT